MNVELGQKFRDKRDGEILTVVGPSPCGSHTQPGEWARCSGTKHEHRCLNVGGADYYQPITGPGDAPKADPVAEAMGQFDKLREQVKAHAVGIPGDGPMRPSGVAPKGIPMTTVDNAPTHTSYIVKDTRGNTGTGATMDEAMANMRKCAAPRDYFGNNRSRFDALGDAIGKPKPKPHACRLSQQGAACIVCLPPSPLVPWRSSVDEFDLLPDAAEGWRR